MDPIRTTAPALPGRPVLRQLWRDLVFVHWRVDPSEIAPLMPEGIAPDVFEGATFVGLIPFEMRDSSVLGGPAVPYFGSFTEVNVRLYGVDSSGRRGVVFLSLEASRLAAVLTARTLFSLPYLWARAASAEAGGVLSYRSQRFAAGRPSTRISARPSTTAVTNDLLAEFLTARWLLFVSRGGRTVSMPNEHEPWPVYEAELLHLDDQLIAAAGIASIGSRAPDSVLYSPGVTTSFGLPQRLT